MRCGSGSGNLSDPGIWDPGWKKFGSGIRDKHPGSATLNKTMLLSNASKKKNSPKKQDLTLPSLHGEECRK
jgi:hypothetical protein